MNGEVDNGMTIPMEEDKAKPDNTPANGMIIPTEESAKPKDASAISSPKVIIPVEEPAANTSKTEFIIPMDEPSQNIGPDNNRTTATSKEQKAQTPVPTHQPSTPQPSTTKKKGADMPTNETIIAVDDNTFEVPIDKPTPVKKDENKSIAPANSGKAPTNKPTPPTPKTKKDKPSAPKAQPKKPANEGPVIYFEEEQKPNTDKKNPDDKSQPALDFDFDDEYYDLDGF